MRVILNGLAALKPKTGVGHHVAQLARAFAQEFPNEHVTLYPGRRLSGLVQRFNKPPTNGPRRTSLLKPVLGLAKSLVKSASGLHFAAYSRTFAFDLYHEPNFVPYRCHLPTVVTVHDLSVMRFPEWHPADRVRTHEKRFLKGLQRAAHVIVVSEAIRREMIGDLGFPAHRVSVVYNGVGPAFRPLPTDEVETVRQKLGLPASYLLCVGTIEPRKNLGTVMRAFVDLPSTVREACPLVLVGPWGWKSDADRAFFDNEGQRAGVRHLGYVADAELPALYCGAAGLVYPSHYEGFGLPPVEMMACGGAVIASTADAVREVCGRHADFVAPLDVEGWRDAMHRLATDAEYREALRRGGVAYAAHFTWERAAHETIAVYRSVLGLARDRPASTRAAA